MKLNVIINKVIQYSNSLPLQSDASGTVYLVVLESNHILNYYFPCIVIEL